MNHSEDKSFHSSVNNQTFPDIKKEEEITQQDSFWMDLQKTPMVKLNYSVHWIYDKKISEEAMEELKTIKPFSSQKKKKSFFH